MANLFIQTNANQQKKDLERIQRIQENNERIASTVDKPQGYEWGLIEKLKKNVAPTTETVVNAEQAHQEYMEMIDSHGIGGDKAIYDFAEELLGENYNDAFFKRRLTQYSDYILNKKSDNKIKNK